MSASRDGHPTVDDLRVAAAALPDRLVALGPDPTPTSVRELLLREVHEPVLWATADPAAGPAWLTGLAGQLRACLPEGAENALPVRPRTFIRLLRRDALEPAWLLAQDNASGRVEEHWAWSTSSGARRTSPQLPLTTLVEDGRVLAWLPGLRDPRFDLPDDVYDMTDKVALRTLLEDVRIHGDRLVLAGRAHLTELRADAGEQVRVVLVPREGGQQVLAEAVRVRRPDMVARTGPDLTRLARAGWRAEVPVAALAAAPGAWDVSLEVARGGLVRRSPLGLHAGPLLASAVAVPPVDVGAVAVRLGRTGKGALVVRVSPLRAAARLLSSPVRSGLRRLRG